MRGNPDAVASAYSLDDYRIADDLGGEAAYANLRDRAWARGIRLASDMVPNHMGIDSRWVIEHPEWFLSLDEPPYPGLHVHRPGPVDRRAGRRSSSRTTTGTTATPRSCSSASTAGPARRATSTTATTARASRGTTPRSSTSSTPRSASRSSGRSSTSPGASRSSASTRRWSSPRSTSSGCGGREPGTGGGIPSRAEHAISQARVRRADAGRVLARGRRPGRRRGARHAAARRGVLAARGLLRPDARHAPRLQQRVHAHAPRRGRRRLPQGHQGDARVRPGDPQALRQLHEQPGREDRASSSSARATSTSASRPSWRRCPGCRCSATARSRASARSTAWSSAGRSSTSSRIRGWSSATSARSSRSSTAGHGSPSRTTSCCTTS